MTKKKAVTAKKRTKYTVDYFIKKFTAIPLKEWTTGVFTNSKGQHCALGHCGSGWNGPLNKYHTPEGEALRGMFEKYLGVPVYDINDFNVNSPFKRKTIKGRIIAGLKLIKVKQEASK